MFNRKPRVSGAYLLLLASLSPRASRADSRSIGAEHALAGVRAVDHVAKTVVIHTANGGEEPVALGDDTVVHDVTSAGSVVAADTSDA
jgi:hypothetical protein